MGVSLESLALALAAMGLGAPMEDPQPEITYRFRSVEVRGLAWRDVGIGLKPVAQHSAVSVWTCPDDFVDRLPAEAVAVAETPSAVKGLSQTPVHLASSRNQQFVTRVVNKGKSKSPEPIVESVREGVTATVVGRKIDQGVLTQLVIDDVDVRSVHTLKPASSVKQVRADVVSPASEPCPYMASQAAEKHTSVVAVSVTASMEPDAKAIWQPSKSSEAHGDCKEKMECCRADTKAIIAKSDAAAARAAWFADGKLQIPEIGRASAAGEWLIPEGEVLVIGFGPHTIADADGKAVVREHLIVISAEVDEEESPIVVPDRTRSEEAKPATTPSTTTETPRTAVKLPELPGRTLPQGVHPDGTPAALPALPEDEEPAEAADQSDETRATPQSRKKASPQMRPATPSSETGSKTDAKALKSSFSLPALKTLPNIPPLNSLVNSGLFPIPFHGAQFLVPLKPLALKLPFNQKLEFELVGRVVTDPEAAGRLMVEN